MAALWLPWDIKQPCVLASRSDSTQRQLLWDLDRPYSRLWILSSAKCEHSSPPPPCSSRSPLLWQTWDLALSAASSGWPRCWVHRLGDPVALRPSCYHYDISKPQVKWHQYTTLHHIYHTAVPFKESVSTWLVPALIDLFCCCQNINPSWGCKIVPYMFIPIHGEGNVVYGYVVDVRIACFTCTLAQICWESVAIFMQPMQCAHPRHHASFQGPFLRGKQDSAVSRWEKLCRLGFCITFSIVCNTIHIDNATHYIYNYYITIYSVSVNGEQTDSLFINILKKMAHPPHYWVLRLFYARAWSCCQSLWVVPTMNELHRLLPIDPVNSDWLSL